MLLAPVSASVNGVGFGFESRSLVIGCDWCRAKCVGTPGVQHPDKADRSLVRRAEEEATFKTGVPLISGLGVAVH